VATRRFPPALDVVVANVSVGANATLKTS
jgi:hypothetical protein